MKLSDPRPARLCILTRALPCEEDLLVQRFQLPVRPSHDAMLAAQLLERGQAQAQLFRHGLFGQVQVLRQLFDRHRPMRGHDLYFSAAVCPTCTVGRISLLY